MHWDGYEFLSDEEFEFFTNKKLQEEYTLWAEEQMKDRVILEPPPEYWEDELEENLIWNDEEISEPTEDLIVGSFEPPTISTTANYLPVLHGKATDGICFNMINKPIERNLINNTGQLSTRFATLIIENFNDTNRKVSPSTHKLLTCAIAKFAEINNTGNKNRQLHSLDIRIPLKEYAAMCGYDIMPRQTNTKEEEKADKKRIANTLRNARKKIRKDLDILFSAKLSWREKVAGREENFEDMRLIDSKGIENGYINISFAHTFAERYLIRLPITKYPTALLAIDERNNNAYALAVKFSEHYNMNAQQGKRNAQALKIKTLLAVTTLPNIQEVRNKHCSWRVRIKEPFEQSLDELYQNGVLTDWNYAHSNGIPLTDEEACNWESYEQWVETLVYFSLDK